MTLQRPGVVGSGCALLGANFIKVTTRICSTMCTISDWLAWKISKKIMTFIFEIVLYAIFWLDILSFYVLKRLHALIAFLLPPFCIPLGSRLYIDVWIQNLKPIFAGFDIRAVMSMEMLSLIHIVQEWRDSNSDGGSPRWLQAIIPEELLYTRWWVWLAKTISRVPSWTW